MKVKVYEYEEEEEPVEVITVTQNEYQELLNTDKFVCNTFQLRTIKETKEERWLCQTPDAVGKMFGKEYVLEEGRVYD